MQRTVILGVLLITLAATGAAASEPRAVAQSPSADDLDFGAAAEQFNNNTAALPGFVKTLIGDQRINLHLTVDGQNETLGIVMEGIQIQNTSEEALDDPSLEVWLSEEAIRQIMESDAPIEEFSARLESGEISYQVNGTGNKVLFWITENLFKLAQVVGLA